MENTNTAPAATSWWNANRWLTFLAVLFSILVAIYFLWHVKKGAEYFRLNAKQVQRISSMVFMDTTVPKDTLNKNLTAEQDSTVMRFLRIELNGDLDEKLDSTIRTYLAKVDKREAVAFLTDSRFKVNSYFYLAGPAVYFEVIFWALFGVLGSLLYYVSDAQRKKEDGTHTAFDPDEIPYQIAKFFYAPLSTLILVLGYGLMTSQNLVDIDAGKGMIVFAFISGFYSGRTMNFLDRLKELLLPGNEPQPQQQAQPKTATNLATDVKVALSLDSTGLSNAQKNEIVTHGWKDATVVLKSANSATPVELEKPVEDQGNIFTGTNMPFGTYTIEVLFPFKHDNTTINLKGNKDVEIKQPSVQFEVAVKKTDA